MEKFANRDCCDVEIRDYYSNAPVMFIDFCNTNSIELTSDSIYAKRNGMKYIKFDSPLEGTITITFQAHPFYVYSMLNGNDIKDSAIVMRREEIIANRNGELDLEYTPISGTIYVNSEENFLNEEVSGIVADKIFVSKDIKKGIKYCVTYLENKNYGIKKISFNNSNLSRAYHIQMITTNKNEYGEYIPIRLIAYKAIPKREMELSFASDGEPMEISMSFECFENENGDVLSIAEVYDLDGTEITDAIWINMETGMLETTSKKYVTNKQGVLFYQSNA